MTFLVGMCGTTMVFKAGLAERCWNGDLNGVDDWQSDPKLFVVEIFKKRIWLESKWWQCTFAYVLSQCKYNILMFSYICIYTGIYIWFLCGYHVIHTIYIFIFLCRLLMVSHIYLFQLDTWQGGLFWTKPLCRILGPPVRQRIKDHMQHSAEGIVNKVGPGHRIGRWLTRHPKTSVLYTYVFVYYIFIDIS